MKHLCVALARLKGRNGAAIIYVATIMMLLLGVAALAVDVGYVLMVKNELQDAADASALAATGRQGFIYESMLPEQQQDYICQESEIFPVAREVALANVAGAQNVAVRDLDIVIGNWSDSAHALTGGPLRCDAVSVTTRRDDTAGGPIGTFFARTFGTSRVSLAAEATAALTGIPFVDLGGLPIPVGISERWFDTHRDEPLGYCGRSIRFYPTDEENCAGWHTFFQNADANNLKQIIDFTKEFESPPLSVGQTVNFFGTAGGTLFNPGKDYFLNLFNHMKDPTTGTWTTTVVVYDKATTNDCNPSGSVIVKGFATVVITEVLGSTQGKTIVGKVLCDYQESRGGGGDYGTLGTIPGLVR